MSRLVLVKGYLILWEYMVLSTCFPYENGVFRYHTACTVFTGVTTTRLQTVKQKTAERNGKKRDPTKIEETKRGQAKCFARAPFVAVARLQRFSLWAGMPPGRERKCQRPDDFFSALVCVCIFGSPGARPVAEGHKSLCRLLNSFFCLFFFKRKKKVFIDALLVVGSGEEKKRERKKRLAHATARDSLGV